MRSTAIALLVLGMCKMETFSLPVKSVFVTFPGDVIKNMTDVEMADVSSRWHDHLFKDRSAFTPKKASAIEAAKP